jgi:hypothetical protein
MYASYCRRRPAQHDGRPGGRAKTKVVAHSFFRLINRHAGRSHFARAPTHVSAGAATAAAATIGPTKKNSFLSFFFAPPRNINNDNNKEDLPNPVSSVFFDEYDTFSCRDGFHHRAFLFEDALLRPPAAGLGHSSVSKRTKRGNEKNNNNATMEYDFLASIERNCRVRPTSWTERLGQG